MKIYGLSFSPTGGTQKVLDAFMSGFGQEWELVNLIEKANTPLESNWTEEDVVVVAYPVYGGRIPYTVVRKLNEVTGNNAKAVALAVFGNRAIDDALVEAEDLLKERGFKFVAGVEAVAKHSIFTMYASDRPDAQDSEELARFAKEVLANLDKEEEPTVPGNRPYKEYNYFGSGNKPKADDTCIECMICANECPEQAIPMDDVKNVDETKCIACLHCIGVCPVGARSINWDAINERAKEVEPIFGPRKENKLYL